MGGGDGSFVGLEGGRWCQGWAARGSPERGSRPLVITDFPSNYGNNDNHEALMRVCVTCHFAGVTGWLGSTWCPGRVVASGRDRLSYRVCGMGCGF